MDKQTDLYEEDFLAYILKAYFQKNEIYFQNLINIELVEQAINLLTAYFENEDTINNFNHIDIVKRIFSDDNITGKNCNSELGISNKTYYRYKQKYIKVFKNYLTRILEQSRNDFSFTRKII